MENVSLEYGNASGIMCKGKQNNYFCVRGDSKIYSVTDVHDSWVTEILYETDIARKLHFPSVV